MSLPMHASSGEGVLKLPASAAVHVAMPSQGRPAAASGTTPLLATEFFGQDFDAHAGSSDSGGAAEPTPAPAPPTGACDRSVQPQGRANAGGRVVASRASSPCPVAERASRVRKFGVGKLGDVLVRLGTVGSRTQVRRLLRDGRLRVDGELERSYARRLPAR